MLVMRRRAGESFLIGADIEIQILEVSHSRVRIGVTAPASVPIVRKEAVLTREENLTAARSVSMEGIVRISRMLRSAAVSSPVAEERAEESAKNSRKRSEDPDM